MNQQPCFVKGRDIVGTLEKALAWADSLRVSSDFRGKLGCYRCRVFLASCGFHWQELYASEAGRKLAHSQQSFLVKRLDENPIALSRLIEAMRFQDCREFLGSIETQRFVKRKVFQLNVQPRAIAHELDRLFHRRNALTHVGGIGGEWVSAVEP